MRFSINHRMNMHYLNKINYIPYLSKEVKKDKLKNFAESVFSNPLYAEELECLMLRLNLSKAEIIDAYIAYDLDILSYDNKIYSPLAMRFVLHLHNLLEGSWHIERQKAISDLLREISPQSILDLGFGVPTQYIHWVMSQSNASLTLCDFSESAITFAEPLLDIWYQQWQNKINFVTTDMSLIAKKKTNYDLYLFQDSIEHVDTPTECLVNFVQNSKETAYFLLSLPIGPLIPMHSIAWETVQDAHSWLENCGLTILYWKQVRTNPEVDLFASDIEEGFVNYIALCCKHRQT